MMEYNWQDVQEDGILETIQTPNDYQRGYAKGIANANSALLHLPAPIWKSEDLKKIHQLLFEHVSPWAGKFHWKQHMIGGSPGSDPDMIEELKLIGLQLELLQPEETSPENVIRIAAFYHIRLVTCHLFPDGNGRTARLLMDHYLETRLEKSAPGMPETRAYLDAFNLSLKNDNLAPLANVFSQSWLGHPEKTKVLPSPFRLTPFQLEPWKQTWMEASTRGPTGWISTPLCDPRIDQ